MLQCPAFSRHSRERDHRGGPTLGGMVSPEMGPYRTRSAPPPLPQPEVQQPALGARIWRKLIGAPRSLADASLFHRLSLIPFLAWVGLGADGLSSSPHGPQERFRPPGEP